MTKRTFTADDNGEKYETVDYVYLTRPPEIRVKPIPKAVEKKNCWLWAGGTVVPDDYGLLWHEGRMQRAHRLVYEALVGEIPKGLEIDHLCRVTRCVNPEHLEPVTHQENLRRAGLLMRQTVCLRGHDLTDPSNIKLSFSKARNEWYRGCRACRRLNANERNAKARAALKKEAA